MNKLPSQQTMYRALVKRDAAFEGIFFVGVKTTGIFCRPTCHAKKPKLGNVEFFANSGQALYGGYRPCKLCRPLDATLRPPPSVERLREAIEHEPNGRLMDKELAQLAIDPSTARRQFKKYFGMTFHAYQRARRMGLALREVREGRNLLDVQLDRGFESASGFRDAFFKMFGRPPSDPPDTNCLLAHWLETPLGPMLALANDQGLCLLEFVDRRGLEREISWLRRRLQCAVVPGSNAHLEMLGEQLARYFAGTQLQFNLPLVLEGSVFQLEVWKLLRAIPPGMTKSYSEMAVALGRPQARRAVGRANGENRLALVVPCHRVVRADGSLCGYAGGVWRKKWLLDHERRTLGLERLSKNEARMKS